MSADWYLAARERCHTLAVDMVRLDRLAADFEAERSPAGDIKADRVRWDRDLVRHERSLLLRELWWARRSLRRLVGARVTDTRASGTP